MPDFSPPLLAANDLSGLGALAQANRQDRARDELARYMHDRLSAADRSRNQLAQQAQMQRDRLSQEERMQRDRLSMLPYLHQSKDAEARNQLYKDIYKNPPPATAVPANPFDIESINQNRLARAKEATEEYRRRKEKYIGGGIFGGIGPTAAGKRAFDEVRGLYPDLGFDNTFDAFVPGGGAPAAPAPPGNPGAPGGVAPGNPNNLIPTPVPSSPIPSGPSYPSLGGWRSVTPSNPAKPPIPPGQQFGPATVAPGQPRFQFNQVVDPVTGESKFVQVPAE